MWAPAKQPYLPPPLPQAECWVVVESGPWRGVTSAPEGVCKNSAVEVLSDSWLSYCLSSRPAVASLLIASLCSPCTTITGLFNTQALELNYPPPLFRWLHSLPLPFWSDHAFILQVTDDYKITSASTSNSQHIYQNRSSPLSTVLQLGGIRGFPRRSSRLLYICVLILPPPGRANSKDPDREGTALWGMVNAPLPPPEEGRVENLVSKNLNESSFSVSGSKEGMESRRRTNTGPHSSSSLASRQQWVVRECQRTYSRIPLPNRGTR